MIEIRKTISLRETVLSELGVEANRPIRRRLAVIRNPFAGQFVEDLRPLFEAGAMLGERLMPELVKLLDGPAISYGKGAIVGVAGEMEHGGACVHPMLGKPMRAAIGGGKAVIGSSSKSGRPMPSASVAQWAGYRSNNSVAQEPLRRCSSRILTIAAHTRIFGGSGMPLRGVHGCKAAR
jgi:hypothetical protein